MNLFISDNFIDTIGNHVNVLQVIRQVAGDEEVVHAEVLSITSDLLDYVDTDHFEEDLQEGNVENVELINDTLYLCGPILGEVFEELFPGDYTSVINNLVNALEGMTNETVRLDHNCVPVANVPAQDDWLSDSAPVLTAAVRPVEPFQGDSAEPAVSSPEVAVLNSEAILGTLKVGGVTVSTRLVAGKNGVLFNAMGLYFAVYKVHFNPDYLQQMLIQNRMSIDPEDFYCLDGIYLTSYALAKLHPHLSHFAEWQPLVAKVVGQYLANPYADLNIDFLGNPEA